VRRLDLSDFRNYAALRLEPGPGLVVLTGANGAGKTNLLEAVSFLAPGRGLRRARLAEVARAADGGRAGAWAVAAHLDSAAGPVELGTGYGRDADAEGERRVARIDGRAVTGPAAFAEFVDLAWLTPAMDRLFADGASARRRFLDRLTYGADPGHARRVGAFERAMRERARLLAEGRGDDRWLAALEETMAEQGVAVAWARREQVARLAGAVASARGPFPGARLALSGVVEDWLAEMPALAAEDAFRARLAANRGRDAAAGTASEGPHRSDLEVRHAASDQPAAQCSTGEQKALVIAIVLANARLTAARRGRPPILLLDEVAAHLDRVRRQALFDEIGALGGQAWLTGTEPALFVGLEERAQFFAVLGGGVVPDEPALRRSNRT
jgi:DNA replication and repair protein RecF